MMTTTEDPFAGIAKLIDDPRRNCGNNSKGDDQPGVLARTENRSRRALEYPHPKLNWKPHNHPPLRR